MKTWQLKFSIGIRLQNTTAISKSFLYFFLKINLNEYAPTA
jgi:hypothetical protein